MYQKEFSKTRFLSSGPHGFCRIDETTMFGRWSPRQTPDYWDVEKGDQYESLACIRTPSYVL